ncbi:MAG: hypothetical protein FWD13_08950 [Treponema sp.]|nr:hypothetical protein [Treponema sp.]
MKKLGFLIVIVAILALAACAGTKTAASTAPVVEPPPPGTERLTLANAAMALYRFDLPEGQTWGNYTKLTVDYLVDDENITKHLRSGCVRLLGNYVEDVIKPGRLECIVNLGEDKLFAQSLIVNWNTNWAGMGAKPNEWFTVEYNISGSAAHAQFNRANVPAANATGPFFFALGLTSQDDGRRNAITQLVRNITLHHTSDPELNVISTGSGLEVPAFASYYPVFSSRVSNF